MAKCKIKNADLGVLLVLATKYDVIMSKDPSKERKEQQQVTVALVNSEPVSMIVLLIVESIPKPMVWFVIR